MYKLNKLLLVTFVSFIAINGFSNDIFSNFKKSEVNGLTVLEGKDQNGIPLQVINSEYLPDNSTRERCLNFISSMENIPVEEVRITCKENNSLDLLFYVDKFSWNDQNISDHLNSGFTITLGEEIDYYADLFVDDMHLRVDGSYISETALLDKFSNIISKPGTFLMSRDPEFIYDSFSQLKKEMEAIKSENERLASELKELQFNNLVMENRGLFGGIKPLDRESVNWIIEAKSSDLSLTSVDIKDKLLEEKDVKVDLGLVNLIMGLYFGEYN